MFSITIFSTWKLTNNTSTDRNDTYLNTSHSGSVTVYNKTCVSKKSLNESSEDIVIQNAKLYVTIENMKIGRLGNQMFRYAALLGIARAQGRQLFVAPGSDLQNTFKIRYVLDTQVAKGWTILSNNKDLAFDETLMNLPCKDLRLRGYFQSYKYFLSVGDEVRQEYKFHDTIATQASTILHGLRAIYKDSIFVGVHVRRGDFLGATPFSQGVRVPQKSYFVKAFDWVKSKFPLKNITFLVATDDFGWCSANLISQNVVALPQASGPVHMAVLSGCDHVIISGGTFGWWSGWLAGGYVIYYKDYLPKGTPFGDALVTEDYYPRSWVGFGD